MKKYIIATIFVCAVSSSLYAQEQCPGESLTISKYEEVPASWTDCFGKIIFGSNSGHRVGYKYEGEFKNGKMHGQGTFTWAEEWQGQQYVGELKEGKWHGQGTMTYKDGSKYVGEWKEDNGYGQGTYTFSNGEVYNGEWKEYKRHGQGTMTYKSGAVYNGEWKEDKRHGQGTMTYKGGDETVGEWKGGKLWNGVRIKEKKNFEIRETFTDGKFSSSETVPTKIFQEKIKSANVDKNKCYTLFRHAHYQLIEDGQFYLRRWIDKIKILKPSIDVQTQNYLTANYPSRYLLEDYMFDFGKHHHIWVACENLTESVEVANPFD